MNLKGMSNSNNNFHRKIAQPNTFKPIPKPDDSVDKESSRINPPKK